MQGGIGDYTEAIKLDAKNVDAFYSRGRARFHLGDYQGALADYSQVIAIDPKSADAYANRCSTQLNLGGSRAIDVALSNFAEREWFPTQSLHCLFKLKDIRKHCRLHSSADSKIRMILMLLTTWFTARRGDAGAIADLPQQSGSNPNNAEASKG